MHLVCPHCVAINRVEPARFAQRPVCGQCKESLLTGVPAVLTGETFATFITRTELPVVVDFWADWCGPCQQMAPEFLRAARNLVGRFQFAKVDTEAHPSVSMGHHIRSIPTLVLFRGGTEVDRSTGARSAAEIERWLLAR